MRSNRLFDEPKKRKSRLDSVMPGWRKHEKSSAARTHGDDRPRPGKADGTAIGRKYQRECKFTQNDSISVKRSWLEKIDGEATAAGRTPVLVIGFGEMKVGVDLQWALVPLRHFVELTGEES